MKAGEPVLNYEEPQTTPDGSQIWLRTSKVPCATPKAGDGCAGNVEDITDRKRAEERFRTFQALAENALDASRWLTGRQSRYANRAYYDLTGYTYGQE